MNIQEKKNFLINAAFTAFVAALIYLTVKFALAYLLPFIIGIVLSFVMQKPSEILSKKLHIKKNICTTILISAAFVLIVTVITALVWYIAVSAGSILSNYSGISKQIKSIYFTIKNTLGNLYTLIPYEVKNSIDSMLDGMLDNLLYKISDYISSITASALKGLPAFLISSIVTVVASFYISNNYSNLKKFFISMIKPERLSKIITVKNILTGSILKIAVGYILIMLITFVELSVAFCLLGIKHFIGLSAVISVIDILPILGVGTALIPWSVYSFIIGNYSYGIYIIFTYLIITVVRNFAEPKIIGQKLGVNPLLTLITVFVGLKVSGIVGMVFLPISVVVIIKYYKLQLEEEKENSTAKNQDTA